MGSFDLTAKCVAIFGAGYVGGALARELLARGADVVALTRNAARAQVLEEEGVRVVVADLASADWHNQIARADWVVNCVSSGGGGAEGYRKSYVEGTASILGWLERVGAANALVYTSSTSVYPQIEGGVDETSPTQEATGNARLLLEAEALVLDAPRQGRSRRAVVLRLAGIYGPGRHHILDQLRSGVRPLAGRGEHRLNLAHREDIVAAIVAALRRDEVEGVFNIADDAPTPKAEVVRWLAGRLGVAPPGFSGEPVPGRRAVTPDRVVVNARAKAVLGWSPRFPDFRTGYEAILGA